MTKKDYIRLAEALATAASHDRMFTAPDRAVWQSAIAEAAVQIARVLRSDNSRFDWERFMDACGVERT